MSDEPPVDVLVRVAGRGGTRQIGVAEKLDRFAERMAGVKAAVTEAARGAALGLEDLPQPPGWRAGEVTVSFGVAFTAESSVILTKASGEASLEVSIVYRRVE